MRARRIGGVVAGAIVGLAVGVVGTIALQGSAAVPEHAPRPVAEPSPFTIPLRPDTFLAWVPGGMPPGTTSTFERIGARRVVVVASDNTWLTRSVDADGEVVDDPPRSFAIPLEVAAVDPEAYAPFLPPADRSLVVALARGQGVLGEMSAKLRGLGAGATMRFGDVEVEIAAGDFIGFPTDGTPHVIRNSSDADLVFLQGGERREGDRGVFPTLGKIGFEQGDSMALIDADAVQLVPFSAWFADR